MRGQELCGCSNFSLQLSDFVSYFCDKLKPLRYLSPGSPTPAIMELRATVVICDHLSAGLTHKRTKRALRAPCCKGAPSKPGLKLIK